MEPEQDPRAAALERAVRQCGEAWARGDAAALENMLSPTYTHGDVHGHLQDRAAWLDYARGRAGRTTHLGFRDLRWRIIGDVAVVTGTNDIRGDGNPAPGAPQDFTIRFTQVWVRHGGRLLREAFQATPSGSA